MHLQMVCVWLLLQTKHTQRKKYQSGDLSQWFFPVPVRRHVTYCAHDYPGDVVKVRTDDGVNWRSVCHLHLQCYWVLLHRELH
jgi:hypothetical protein